VFCCSTLDSPRSPLPAIFILGGARRASMGTVLTTDYWRLTTDI